MEVSNQSPTIEIDNNLYSKLISLGIIPTEIRKSHVGSSNYSQHVTQPWSIWLDYKLNPWDADITKRILRTKAESGMSETEARIMDYEKIIHICQERIRQLEASKPETTTKAGTVVRLPLYQLMNKEVKNFEEFVAEHANCKGKKYWDNIATGIGHKVIAHCTVCGASKDITDYSNW